MHMTTPNLAFSEFLNFPLTDENDDSTSTISDAR